MIGFLLVAFTVFKSFLVCSLRGTLKTESAKTIKLTVLAIAVLEAAFSLFLKGSELAAGLVPQLPATVQYHLKYWPLRMGK